MSLGIRVPLIVVSPYARAGYVSHVVHTTGSVLHFAEEALNVPSLGEEDARADDLTDAFDFTQAPQCSQDAHQARRDQTRREHQPGYAGRRARRRRLAGQWWGGVRNGMGAKGVGIELPRSGAFDCSSPQW